MEPLFVVGVEIDRCAKCGGLWLDVGEIKQLAQAPDDAMVQAGEIHLAVSPTESGLTDGLLDKPCPACGGKLTHAVFDETGVEQCSACHGIYLDRGELQNAMDLVDTNQATTIVALAKSVETSGTL
jgi:Zn-finger nucleic acid-binding protein